MITGDCFTPYIIGSVLWLEKITHSHWLVSLWTCINTTVLMCLFLCQCIIKHLSDCSVCTSLILMFIAQDNFMSGHHRLWRSFKPQISPPSAGWKVVFPLHLIHQKESGCVERECGQLSLSIKCTNFRTQTTTFTERRVICSTLPTSYKPYNFCWQSDEPVQPTPTTQWLLVLVEMWMQESLASIHVPLHVQHCNNFSCYAETKSLSGSRLLFKLLFSLPSNSISPNRKWG